MLLSRSAADLAVARRRLAQIAAELADRPTTEETSADADESSAPSLGSSAESPPESSAEPPVGSPVAGPTGLRSGRHAVRAGLLGRLSGRLADGLPATLRGRWGITAHHVTVIALLVATALAGATWWALRAQPEPVGALPGTDLPSAAPMAGAPTTGPASASASATAGPVLVVHVAGKVRRPGIVELPAGSRVIDALRAAGGARKGVDVSGLNLARPLADGEQIVVGPAPSTAGGGPGPPMPSGGSVPAAPGTALVNLNTATGAELEQLPGVGPVTASSILEWRTEHGRFSTVDELLEVSGIGEKTLAELRDLVTV